MTQIYVAKENRRNFESLYHKMSLAELQTLSPFVSSDFLLDLNFRLHVRLLNIILTDAFFRCIVIFLFN